MNVLYNVPLNKLKVFQIKIILSGIKPEIFRIVNILENTTLKKLHSIIQRAMGWKNEHQYHFIINKDIIKKNQEKKCISDVISHFIINKSNNNQDKQTIYNNINRKNDNIYYEYDFGDGWMHEINILNILEFNPNIKYPEFIDGKRACPPEDSGGIFCYKFMVDILKNPNKYKKNEYEEVIGILGDTFDPEQFNVPKFIKN